jgi:hypothetical protein
MFFFFHPTKKGMCAQQHATLEQMKTARAGGEKRNQTQNFVSDNILSQKGQNVVPRTISACRWILLTQQPYHDNHGEAIRSNHSNVLDHGPRIIVSGEHTRGKHQFDTITIRHTLLRLK